MSSRTATIVLPCLLGMTVALYFLYKDFRSTSENGNAAIVGILLTGDSGVERKVSDSYLWMKIEESTPLYRNDAVRTGPDSHAVIELSDGKRIEVEPDTMVVLDSHVSTAPTIRRTGIRHNEKRVAAPTPRPRAIKKIVVALPPPAPLATAIPTPLPVVSAPKVLRAPATRVVTDNSRENSGKMPSTLKAPRRVSVKVN